MFTIDLFVCYASVIINNVSIVEENRVHVRHALCLCWSADSKLQHIMEELLQTEREYVRALGYVVENYIPELERPDVPQDLRGQRGSIFGNLEKLRDFHQHHFLQELELCLKEPFCVGRCFLKHVSAPSRTSAQFPVKTEKSFTARYQRIFYFI